MKRHSHGLTLIEIMIVIAILSLMIVALVLAVMPSDDRRVHLEADRLAVYLTETSADAVMRDGRTRAEFLIDTQRVERSFARDGAVISQNWETDEKAGPFIVKEPVRLTDLVTPAVNLDGGSGFITFLGKTSPGGVAVLKLNEAIYSVIVEPSGSVRVEKGKGKIGNGAERIKRPDSKDRPSLAGLGGIGSGLSGGSGGYTSGTGNYSSGGDRGRAQRNKSKNSKKNRSSSGGNTGGTGNNNSAGSDDDPNFNDPVNAPLTPKPPKSNGSDKSNKQPPPGTSPQGNDKTLGVVLGSNVALETIAWRLEEIQVALPFKDADRYQIDTLIGTNEILESQLKEFFTRLFEDIEMAVYVEGKSGSGTRAWLAQVVAANDKFVVSKTQPAFSVRTNDPELESFACGILQCHRLPFGHVNLVIEKDLQDQDEDECKYQPLRVKVSVDARYVKEDPNGDAEVGDPYLAFRLLLTRRNAEKYFARTPNGRVRLSELLDDLDVKMGADTNGDTEPDGWNLYFDGPAIKDPSIQKESFIDSYEPPELCSNFSINN